MKKTLIKASLLAALLPLANCVAVEVNPVCGDGFTERLEACDDGNNRNGDGCSASCAFEPAAVCGNNVKEGTEACDDNNTVSGDGCSATCMVEPGVTYGVAWKIKTNNIAGACPAGFNTARVIAHPSSLPTADKSQDIIDLFSCATGQGVSAELPRRSYDLYLDITNQQGNVVYAQSVPALLDLTTATADVSFDIHTDRGYFYANWALQGGTTGNALTCAAVPTVDKIALDATDAASVLQSTTFECAQEAGYTLSLLAGNYQVSMQAINTAGGFLGAATLVADQPIAKPNLITNLGTKMILVDGR